MYNSLQKEIINIAKQYGIDIQFKKNRKLTANSFNMLAINQFDKIIKLI